MVTKSSSFTLYSKKHEFQLQAAGTRFSLIYSADGRYWASQIHSYFRQIYNFFINLQFFQIFLINQLHCLHKTIISLCLLVKLCQYEFLSMFLKLEILNIKVSLRHIFHSTYHWHDLQISVSIDNR